MAVLYTKAVDSILEQYKGHSYNPKLRQIFLDSDAPSKKRYFSPEPFDKLVIEHALEKYHSRGSVMTEKEFVIMALRGSILYFRLGLNQYRGKYGWKEFNSPPEVFLATIPLRLLKWNDRVRFNIKDPTGTYEVDEHWLDIDSNTAIILDVHGEATHKGKEAYDKEKFVFLNESTKYLQFSGTDVTSNFIGVLASVRHSLAESYASMNIPYFDPFDKKKK